MQRITLLLWIFLMAIGAVATAQEDTIQYSNGIFFTALEKQGSLPFLFAEKNGVLYSFANKGDTLLENRSLGLSISIPKGFRKEILETWIEREILSSNQTMEKLTIIGTIYFDFNSALIRNDASAELDKLAELMLEYSFAQVIGFVHTDSRGSPSYNKKLAAKRGNSILKYFKSTGVDLSKFVINISGEEELFNDCNDQVDCDEIAHQMNRRAEFIFNPLAK